MADQDDQKISIKDYNSYGDPNTKTIASTTPQQSSTMSTNLVGNAADHAPDKYRHVAAVHSRQRLSILSTGHEGPISFLGFRNLTVIVLSGFFLRPLGMTYTKRWTSRHDPSLDRGELYEGTTQSLSPFAILNLIDSMESLSASAAMITGGRICCLVLRFMLLSRAISLWPMSLSLQRLSKPREPLAR